MSTLFSDSLTQNGYEKWKRMRDLESDAKKMENEMSPRIAKKIDAILEKRLDDYFNEHKLEIITDIIFARTYSEEKSRIVNEEYEKMLEQVKASKDSPEQADHNPRVSGFSGRRQNSVYSYYGTDIVGNTDPID